MSYVTLCRRCGRRPAATSDGYCIPCKKKEFLKVKLAKFGRRQQGINRALIGDLSG